jgi:hypothetical protein
MSRWSLVPVGLIALCAACESNPAASPAIPFAVRFSVINDLVSPVTISVDSVPYVILPAGQGANLTVPSAALWLTWTSAKPAGSNGVAIPDDLSEVRMSVSGIGTSLDISNVINDQTYITAGIYNLTSASVSIGVYDGTSVECASELPAAVGATIGFTQIGYYKLLLATELRAYRAPSGCTGPFIAWSSSQLKAFKDKSGLLTLTLDSLP